MAFMMPSTKYSVYSNNSTPKQRRPSEQVDGVRKVSSAGGGTRKIKSGDPSLSTSPSSAVVANNGVPRTKPIGMKRVRGSAPALIPGSQQTTPLHQKRPEGCVRPSTSAPTGNPPPPVYSPARSSSSSSSSESTGAFGKFHSRLVMRLRKTLRIKDPVPASS